MLLPRRSYVRMRATGILSELVRWSLVEYQRPDAEGEGRYHLHDLVRIFAAGRLEEAGSVAARNDAQQRHSEYFKYVLSSATELYQNGDALCRTENIRSGKDEYRGWLGVGEEKSCRQQLPPRPYATLFLIGLICLICACILER